MSAPIMRCRFMRALDNQSEFDSLVRDMAPGINPRDPRKMNMSICDCNHVPPCRPITPEEEALIKPKIMAAIMELRKAPNAKWLY